MTSQKPLQFTLFSHDNYQLTIPTDPINKIELLESLPCYEHMIDWKGKRLETAPVVRLYGRDQSGLSVCLHVHNYFPYFYVKMTQVLSQIDQKNTKEFLDKFINLLVNCYYQTKRVNSKYQPGQTSSSFHSIVKNFELIYRKDIYGYHENQEPFLKIYYSNPKLIGSLIEVLESGIIMGKKFDVYEGHLTFMLRFYSEIDLEGLGEVIVDNYTVRETQDQWQELLVSERNDPERYNEWLVSHPQPSSQQQQYQSQPLSQQCSGIRTIRSNLSKQSTCSLECDVEYTNIRNWVIQKAENDIRISNTDNNHGEVKWIQPKSMKEQFEVSLSKSLRMFWSEEQRLSEQYFGKSSMSQGITGTIDYSENIESAFIDVNEQAEEKRAIREKTINDCYWIDQINMSQSMKLSTIKHIQEYIQSKKEISYNQLNKLGSNIDGAMKLNGVAVDQGVMKEFKQLLDKRKNEGIEYMSNRFHNYSLKMKGYYQSLRNGEITELEEQQIPIKLQKNGELEEHNSRINQTNKFRHVIDGEQLNIDEEKNEMDEENQEFGNIDEESHEEIFECLDQEEEEIEEEDHMEGELDQNDEDETALTVANSNQLSKNNTSGNKLHSSGKVTEKKRITLQYENGVQAPKEAVSKQLKSNINELLSGNKKTPGMSNNVQIWRDNYSVSKNNADLSANSPFGTCNLCNTANYFCKCNIFDERDDITELETSQFQECYLINNENNSSIISDFTVLEQLQLSKKESQFSEVFNYHKKCPSFAEIASCSSSIAHEHQYAFYSNLDDLFEHYKIPKSIPRTLHFAQLLQKNFIKVPAHKQHYVGIRNQLKLPIFWRCRFVAEPGENYLKGNINLPADEELQRTFVYQEKCPIFKSISKDIEKRKGEEEKEKIMEQKKFESGEGKRNGSSAGNSTQNCASKGTVLDPKDALNLVELGEDVSLLIFEVFAKSSKTERLPDPSIDPIDFIIFKLENPHRPNISKQGIIIVNEHEQSEDKLRKKYGLKQEDFQDISIVSNEVALIVRFIKHIHQWDIDVITGWDIEKKSLFYLAHRSWFHGIEIMDILSRCPQNSYNITRAFDLVNRQTDNCLEEENMPNDEEFKISTLESSKMFKQLGEVVMHMQKQSRRNYKQVGDFANFKLNFNIQGRMILNLWRVVKHENKLSSYELESVCQALLHVRLPIFSNWSLTGMYQNQTDTSQRAYVIKYFISRVKYTSLIMAHTNIINICAQEAHLFRFDLQSVINKGHQFRLESIMNRITEDMGYKLLSASKHGVQMQKIHDFSPLTLEPPKLFYSDPVVVLDFQSLYPSVMIAYNMCFSTCLGNIDQAFSPGGFKKLGVLQNHHVDFDNLLKNANYDYNEVLKSIFVANNKTAFVRKSVRQGVLPQILHEFLFTRIFIKERMKKYKTRADLQSVYDMIFSRQKALKLFMCVACGYTGATYSGRMPLGELAEAVISTGRYLLSQVIHTINNHKQWKAKVIYGDTDSVFVNLQGRSVEQAVTIGKQIEKEISQLFPYPIKLQYEKTFRELVTLSKKRYVGIEAEKGTDEGRLEAKGIEMIRSDGCHALKDIMKNCLLLLFKTKDLSRIKLFLTGKWQDLLSDKINPRELLLSSKCHLESYSSIIPAHGKIALRQIQFDPMTKPKDSQIINYFLVHDEKTPVVSAQELYSNNHRHALNLSEYFHKQINSPLMRLFATFDAPLQEWASKIKGAEQTQVKKTPGIQQKMCAAKGLHKQVQLSTFYLKSKCLICESSLKQKHNSNNNQQKTNIHDTISQHVCDDCQSNPSSLLAVLIWKKQAMQKKISALKSICSNCAKIDQSGGYRDAPICKQENCEVFYLTRDAEESFNVDFPVVDRCIEQIENAAEAIFM